MALAVLSFLPRFHFVTKSLPESLKREEREGEGTEDPVKSMRERIHAVRDAQ